MQRNLLLPVKSSQNFMWQRRNTRKTPLKDIQVARYIYYKSKLNQHPLRNIAVDEMVHIYRIVPVSELGGECDLLPRGHEAQRLRGGSRLHGRLQQGVEAAGPQRQDRRVREERHHQEGLTQLIDIIVMMRM